MTNFTRAHGLALMAVGMLVFAGTTNDALPAQAFWPALVLCCIGCFVFMKANRIAMEEAEERARRALDPVLGNQRADRFAKGQADADGEKIARMGEREGRHVAARSATAEAPTTADVSSPPEAQQQDSLAEQLQKLQKLRAGGILSEEEFAIAKAKLLG